MLPIWAKHYNILSAKIFGFTVYTNCKRFKNIFCKVFVTDKNAGMMLTEVAALTCHLHRQQTETSLFKFQTLGINSNELNQFRFSLLFFENSGTNPHSIERNRNWTELSVGRLLTELNSADNRPNWWMNWTICWIILIKHHLIVIDSSRTELILTISERVHSERLSLMDNGELN